MIHATVLKNCVNSRTKSVFKDQAAVKCLSSLHDKYAIVPADKASNNIVFVCKSYYFECLIKDTVSAGRLHTNGYELCPSSSQFIFILI